MIKAVTRCDPRAGRPLGERRTAAGSEAYARSTLGQESAPSAAYELAIQCGHDAEGGRPSDFWIGVADVGDRSRAPSDPSVTGY